MFRSCRRRCIDKAKESPNFRFYALYDKVYRKDVLAFAYECCQANGGAAGVDDQTFEDIEAYGVERWLDELAQQLKSRTYQPLPLRRVYIPKPDGKQRPLGIPAIRERTVEMAVVFGARTYLRGRSAVNAPRAAKLIWHMDEPTADPAIIASYLVCREARKHATVLLSGVGGDELFAGYRKHYAHYWAQAYQRIPSGVRGLIDSLLMRLPSLRGTAMKGRLRLAKKMARSSSLAPVERFLMNCTYLDQEQKAALYTSALSDDISGDDAANQHRARFEQVKDADFLNQMLYLDTKIFMTSLNLTYNDKMSLACSVEVRVPFLDRELAEYVAWNVPPSMKLNGFFRPTTKYIFRKAMQDVLPLEILRQPKAGFAAPVDYWLARDLKEMVDDLLSESQIEKRGLFRPEVVRAFVDEHRCGGQDWSMQIWQLLTLELWMQTFIDGGGNHAVAYLMHKQQAATA